MIAANHLCYATSQVASSLSSTKLWATKRSPNEEARSITLHEISARECANRPKIKNLHLHHHLHFVCSPETIIRRTDMFQNGHAKYRGCPILVVPLVAQSRSDFMAHQKKSRQWYYQHTMIAQPMICEHHGTETLLIIMYMPSFPRIIISVMDRDLQRLSVNRMA